jgi:hypothetical protein
MLLVLLWTVVVYVMWLKGRLDLAQRHGDEVPARFRAVLDLAKALNHELSRAGEVSDSLANRQLERRITERLDGGRVAVRVPSPTPATGYSFRKGAWGWIKREKWWLVLLVASVSVPAGMAPLIGPLAVLWAPFPASLVLALAIGRTTESRVLMSLCGFTLLVLFLIAGFGPAWWR